MGIGEGVTVVEHTLDCLGQLLSAGIEDGYMVQAGVALRRRRPTGAVSRVQGDVVMVASGGEKHHTWHADVGTVSDNVEAQHVPIEGGRPL